MGTTVISGRYKNAREFFRDYFQRSLDSGRIIDFAIKGKISNFSQDEAVAYVAYKGDDGRISAFVAIMAKVGQNSFSIKCISEDEGPMEKECPQKILRLLDAPRPDSYATSWRQKCGDTREWPEESTGMAAGM